MNNKDISTLPSLNKLTEKHVFDMLEQASALRLGVSKLENQTTIIDAGIDRPGGLEAGRRIAEICMGGMGKVSLSASNISELWPWQVNVYSANPVLACLGSQYAGWSLSHGEGKQAFNALGSGPGRAMGSKEDLFDELAYRDRHEHAFLVIEVDKIPPIEIADIIARRCDIAPENLYLILTPTSSLAGCVQIVARVLETALHKAHALGFELERVIDGAGSAPLCPPSPDFLKAMSRTNDSILFAGQVQLFVQAGASEAEELANKLPSSASADYGQPFGEIFKSVEYDFYKIDPMLFSPASVAVTSLESGETFHAGKLDLKLLNKSFS
ncbi:MAG: methenyltetrahydromethanopterin cyclohydrolase [Gammaproteobacteria bacterium]|nr:methenyltetrahydromethanopterin cyclohydrolase [Gammaproteobacteria bacterium]